VVACKAMDERLEELAVAHSVVGAPNTVQSR
jgi:hypothetical protein